RTCGNSVHAFHVRRPAVCAFARPDSPLERGGTRGLLRHFQYLLPRMQLFLEAFALGDIANDADDALRDALCVAQNLPPGTDPAWLPDFATKQPVFEFVMPGCSGEDVACHFLNALAIARIERNLRHHVATNAVFRVRGQVEHMSQVLRC